MSYDIIYIFKRLIEKCGEENISCMIKETNKIKNYEGASGKITFIDGEVKKKIYLKTIKNGSFVMYGRKN